MKDIRICKNKMLKEENYKIKKQYGFWQNLWQYSLAPIIALILAFLLKYQGNNLYPDEQMQQVNYSEDTIMYFGLAIGFALSVLSLLLRPFLGNLVFRASSRNFLEDKILFSYQPLADFMPFVQFFIGYFIGTCILPIIMFPDTNINKYILAVRLSLLFLFNIIAVIYSFVFQYNTITLTDKHIFCMYPCSSFFNKSMLLKDIESITRTHKEFIITSKTGGIIGLLAFKKNEANIFERKLKKILNSK